MQRNRTASEHMADDFDEGFDNSVGHRSQRDGSLPADRVSSARLVARLYRVSDAPLRARLLAVLLRPLGTLSLVAVAAGAFGGLLGRSRTQDPSVAMEHITRCSTEQVFELARFVEQVSPQALQQVADLLSENPLGLAAFSSSVAVLLYRRLWPGRDRLDPTHRASVAIED